MTSVLYDRRDRIAYVTIGQPVIAADLDDQLRTEAWNAYTVADPEETLGLLQRFSDRTDAGRA